MIATKTTTTMMMGASFLLLTASTASAKPRNHDGFYFQLSGGLGFYSASTDAGGDQTYSGMTIPTSLLLGGTVGKKVAIGGGITLDYAPSPTYSLNGQDSAIEFKQYVFGIGLFADFYLNPEKGGLHFPAFVGWGGLETSTSNGAGGSDPTGLIVSAGVGYDVYMSDDWSIGGTAKFAYGFWSLGDASYPTIAPALLVNLTYH
jgi:hypothetical protein